MTLTCQNCNTQALEEIEKIGSHTLYKCLSCQAVSKSNRPSVLKSPWLYLFVFLSLAVTAGVYFSGPNLPLTLLTAFFSLAFGPATYISVYRIVAKGKLTLVSP